VKRALGSVAVLAAALSLIPSLPAHADEVEQVVNGGFDSGTAPWWTSSGLTVTPRDGQACVTVPGGTVNRWDVAIGQNDIDLVAGETYRYSFTASGDHPIRAVVGLAAAPYDTYFEAAPALTTGASTFSYTFTSTATTSNAQVALQLGGSPDPWEFCLDNVSLAGGVPPEVYVPDTGPRVRVNQVGYLPDGPKRATLVTAATTALPWQLTNPAGPSRGAAPSPAGWTRRPGRTCTRSTSAATVPAAPATR
jgi:endoglucanase